MIASPPYILALITDLFFAPALKDLAEKQGFAVEWLDSPQPAPDFLHRLRPRRPALIMLDLNATLPWRDWLPAAKTDPETADIPWLAFGSHKAADVLAAARRLGADKVLPKSAFTAELSARLQILAKA